MPPPTPAPRVYLGVTAGGIVRGYRHDVPAALRVAIDEFCEEASSASSREDVLLALRAVLDSHDPDGEAWDISSGPAFVFPETIMVSDARHPHRARAGRPAASRLPLHRHLAPGALALLRGRHRRSRGVHLLQRSPDERVAEAGVDTAEEFRGRGYAALVTAAWANAIRAADITPVYSTSDDNLASQAVARKMGLREFCWDVQVT